MNKKIAHKIISLLTVFILLTPAVIEFSHTLEHHEHKVCNATDTYHIHKEKIDCEYELFKINTDNYILLKPLNFSIIETFEFTLLIDVIFLYQKNYFYTSTRGPPTNII